MRMCAYAHVRMCVAAQPGDHLCTAAPAPRAQDAGGSVYVACEAQHPATTARPALHHAIRAAVCWVLRGYSEQYGSSFHTVIVFIWASHTKGTDGLETRVPSLRREISVGSSAISNGALTAADSGSVQNPVRHPTWKHGTVRKTPLRV